MQENSEFNSEPKATKSPAQAIIFVLLAMIVAVVLFYVINSTKPIGEKYKEIRDLGGPFTAQGTQGPFSLSELQGKVAVLYFGFLSCTEACPDSIAVYQSARRKLSQAERNKVQFVFISVDPARDSMADLKEFEAYFKEDALRVVTDTEANILKLTRQYGVYFDLVDLEGTALQYTVDHSSRFYMVDTTGRLITSMSHTTTPTELAAKVQQLIDKG